MILSDGDILSAMEMGWVRLPMPHPGLQGKLVITPFERKHLQPSSVDLCLGNSFIDDMGMALTFLDHNLILKPHDFFLGCTQEWIEIPPGLIGVLEGKSSFGRRGVIIHATSGYVDPGWKGRLTLEISNLSSTPQTIRPGSPICQIRFMLLTSPAMRPYGSEGLGSHYLGSTGPRL